MAVGEARIASPEEIALQGEATILALPLKASLALLRRAPPLSEAKIALLLALSALVLLLAASLALPNSADDVNGAAVASLLAQSALALASRDRRGLAL